MVDPRRSALILPWLLLLVSVMAPRLADAESTVEMVDQVHRHLSHRLSDFVGQIDDFFGDDEEQARVNESWVRILVDTSWNDLDGASIDGNARLKLVLPRTEDRLRLLLSTTDDDTIGPANSDSVGTTEADVSVALRFLRQIRDTASIKLDLGARMMDSKPQAFIRLGGFYRKDLENDWISTITNNTRYYSSSGFDNRLTFKLERSLQRWPDTLLLFSTQLRWQEWRDGAVLSQVFGWYHYLSGTSSIAYEALTGFQTSPAGNERSFNSLDLRVRYRKNIWRRWFFFELWPGVSWPQENDYQATPEIMLRLESIIGFREPRRN